ncbi:NTP transferase domain-containing protein [Rhodoblastus acidophilus]|uniref:NTP transferase domain-containing protein n=1 Tax=Candidatus Rhodoblastus alkanivorans TaxID=2954117 RepID=A0ABS9Z0M5_9HYPH|nr:NTP transferase domain-containing protein [Candidatus Rhodoblastus alkanivorans]MCI4678154.1 NTP transferase domain-containing protein [Candidatus Rhodoblastus alkanivorans]MCI4681204.1 NTP transferase domain-containing protein [Candidatus Rhodoblastus alkanivorans]MDI4642247.1 NTP transferase domain-containing protein [Rhodoblastus acidophilus]
MKFVTLAIEEACGGLLAHSIRRAQLLIPKGRILAPDDISRLRAAGVARVQVALLDPKKDVAEDAAAARVARALAGSGVIAGEARAGRCDLHAAFYGLLHFDPRRVDGFNHVDEAITLATLPPHEVFEPGERIATIKVNPYAAPERVVAACEKAAAPLKILPFRPHRVALIQTLAPGLKAQTLEKTTRHTRDRLMALSSALCAELRVTHEEKTLSREIAARGAAGDDLILIAGAYSTVDRKDVVPAALEKAGGRVIHFGMPVDPGNLLLLGELGGTPVIGMPGCARAPQLNGVDFILRRLLAGLPVGRADIMSMGVGGLLRDRRANAKTKRAAPPRIAAIVLAAGRSQRMGANKLTMTLDGKPLVRHAADTARAAGIETIVVVVGHEAEKVRAALAGCDVAFVLNEDYAQGLSTSLKKGVAALPRELDGAMIFLGDMPDIDPAMIARMIAAFDPREGSAIVAPRCRGRLGNPVLWGRAFFPLILERTSGDAGAKQLIGRYGQWVAAIDAGDDIFTDLDTAEAMNERRRLGPDPASSI